MYPVPVIVPFNNVVFFRGGRSGIARERLRRNGSNFACASARPMRSVWRRAAMQLTSGFRDPLDKRGLASGFLTKGVGFAVGPHATCASSSRARTTPACSTSPVNYWSNRRRRSRAIPVCPPRKKTTLLNRSMTGTGYTSFTTFFSFPLPTSTLPYHPTTHKPPNPSYT